MIAGMIAEKREDFLNRRVVEKNFIATDEDRLTQMQEKKLN